MYFINNVTAVYICKFIIEYNACIYIYMHDILIFSNLLDYAVMINIKNLNDKYGLISIFLSSSLAALT